MRQLVGLLRPWGGNQLIARALPTQNRQHKQKKRGHAPTPRVGFERAIPIFERANIFRVVECTTLVIGTNI
jgi:hypothetical protein